MTKLMNVEEAKVEASKMNYKVFLQVYDVLNCDFNRIEENDSKPEELRNMERAALILNSTKLDDSQNRALETLIDIIGEQFPRTAEEVEFNGKTFPRTARGYYGRPVEKTTRYGATIKEGYTRGSISNIHQLCITDTDGRTHTVKASGCGYDKHEACYRYLETDFNLTSNSLRNKTQTELLDVLAANGVI